MDISVGVHAFSCSIFLLTLSIRTQLHKLKLDRKRNGKESKEKEWKITYCSSCMTIILKSRGK